MKILLIIVIFAIFLVVISFLWFVWKKNKDIKDMKKGVSDLLTKRGSSRDGAGSGADCFVGKVIPGVGYLRFKEIYADGTSATEKEAAEINRAAASCSISEYISGVFK